MDKFFKFDPTSIGSKGLVFVGDKVLVYRRDANTTNHPLELDLPGGGPEGNETPFETFQREVREEFDLTVEEKHVQYVRLYPSSLGNGRVAYYPVAKLPQSFESEISLGNEGGEYLLLSLKDYLSRDDAWGVFQERAKDYAATLERQ